MRTTAGGVDFDAEAFLETSALEPCKVIRRGDPRRPKTQPNGARYQTSGITVSVSDAERSNLPAQVEDAERFLEINRLELVRLLQSPVSRTLRLTSQSGFESTVNQLWPNPIASLHHLSA